jgi:hypothetical protein
LSSQESAAQEHAYKLNWKNPLSEVIITSRRSPIKYEIKTENFRNVDALKGTDLNWTMLRDGVNSAYGILEAIDFKMLSLQSPRLAQLMELANLSSFLGNLISGAIAKESKGVFCRNRPHAYPDLLHKCGDPKRHLEIKVALENNKPKGHLPKAGNYLTFRYVLGDEKGGYKKGDENRGDVVWIWEIKFGNLSESDFSFSSTEGDSGKTAVIKTKSFDAMALLYFDSVFCPFNRSPYLDKNQETLKLR